MDLQYVYTKKRSEFGRQCLFYDDGPKIMDSLMPNKQLLEEYIRKNPVNRASQCSKQFAEHECNTVRADYDQHGMNHAEGGWPRDVNPIDIEQTMRFRKKVEKDEMYCHTVLNLSHAMEHCILQNNAVNIYEKYFEDQEPLSLAEHISSRTVNVYRDPNAVKRPVTHLSWSPDGGKCLAVTHCSLEFQRTPPDLSTSSYIWEVENPNKPQLMLKPEVPIVCLEYNPKDPHNLVSGMFSGQVSFWDTRRGSEPVETSYLETSHRDPVHNIIWVASKSGTEFFSSSTDGVVKWWDLRKLTDPTEDLVLDTVKPDEQNINRALGISSLEYESTIPTRFMAGTENGMVISCNRKGKTPTEKMSAKFSAHLGPVYALQRNPAFVKNFLTVGDWTARIWSEDCKESSIMWTCNHRALLTDGAWSSTRFSAFFTTRVDGTLDAWDILQQQREATLSVKVCDNALKCLRVHDQGQLVAVGNSIGTSYLVEFSENMATNNKNDKALLTAMFERESRREKILEARIREIRLKLRTKGGDRDSLTREGTPSKASQLVITPKENPVVVAERDFWDTITKDKLAFEELGKEEEEEVEPEEEVYRPSEPEEPEEHEPAENQAAE